MASKDKISQASIFEESEKIILQKTGMPPIFAQFLKEKSETLGVAFALRAGLPMQRYLMPAAPKPSSVKAKTGNWSFTKGVITVDDALGKTEKIEGRWQLIPRTENDFPPPHSKILDEVVHRLSLQETLIGINSGEYDLIGTEQDIEESGHLVIKAKFQFPFDTDVVFRINLRENKSRLVKQCDIDFTKFLITIPGKPPQPAWWNSDWGNFTESLDYYYPAQYTRAQDTDFHDMMVYGLKDGQGKVLPITGDQDLLWISVPSQKHDNLLKDFEEIYNTFEDGGVEKLYRARLALYIRLGGDPQHASKYISNQSLSGLGSVTAYESYVIEEVNQAFAGSGIKHLRNLIQHAAENHNPDKISPLDANMVHVWRGKIYITHSENEILQFVMQTGYPNENIVNVHPKWDMNKWAAFISLQLQLKQPVPEATLSAYKKFRSRMKSFLGLPSWNKKS